MPLQRHAVEKVLVVKLPGAAARGTGRVLLSEPSYCDVRSWERHGGFLLYALGVIYLVLGLVIINNHYFMPSLRRLSCRMRLSDDVAGATIFAGGSSAPFVFFGFFSLLAPSSSIPSAAGIASTVGAGATNVLAVIGAAGALCVPRSASDSARTVRWYPLLRDALAWAVTVLVLGAMASDGMIHWWEGLLMVALYAAYVGLHAANPAIMAALEQRTAARRARPSLPSRHGAAAAHMADSAMDIVDDGAMAADESGAPNSGTARRTPAPKPWAASRDSGPAAASGSMQQSPLAPQPQQPAAPCQSSADQQRLHKLAARGSAADLAALADPHENATSKRPAPDGGRTADDDGSFAAANVHDANGSGLCQPSGASIRSGSPLAMQGGSNAVANRDMTTPGGPQSTASRAAAAAAWQASPRQQPGDAEGALEAELPAFSQLRPPHGWLRRVLWAINLPWYVVLAGTIPDCRAPRLSKLYPITAALAIAWIGGDSWFLLLWTLKVGCVLHAPLTVMGATALAIGSTMLTALVSFVVASQGKAEMAVANVMGSNVFNVLIGLGLPYFVVQAARGCPAVIDTAGLWPDVAVLLVTLGAFLVLLAAARLRLSRGVGAVLLGLYAVYVLYIVLTTWVFDVYGTRDA